MKSLSFYVMIALALVSLTTAASSTQKIHSLLEGKQTLAQTEQASSGTLADANKLINDIINDAVAQAVTATLANIKANGLQIGAWSIIPEGPENGAQYNGNLGIATATSYYMFALNKRGVIVQGT